MPRIRSRLLIALVAFGPSIDSRADEGSLHLVFWQPADIRSGQNVSFEAHPFSEAHRTILLVADPERPSLWYMPTDVVAGPEVVRVYYQRVEKTLPEYLDQRTWCLGLLKDGRFSLPDLGLYPAPWGGPANVVLRRSPRPSTGGRLTSQQSR